MKKRLMCYITFSYMTMLTSSVQADHEKKYQVSINTITQILTPTTLLSIEPVKTHKKTNVKKLSKEHQPTMVITPSSKVASN